MYKTQFFQTDNTESLQEKVNAWLAKEKDIFIVSTNMTSLNTTAGEQYIFYIFYEIIITPVEEAQQIVANQEMDIDPLTKIDFNLQ